MVARARRRDTDRTTTTSSWFALDTEKLGLPSSAKVADVEKAAGQHAIAEGEIVGTYERK